MVMVDRPGGEGEHIGIELFSDQVPDFEVVLQFIGGMPGARFEQTKEPHTLYFGNQTGDLYGNVCLNLTSAPRLWELGNSLAPRAVARVREEFQARMCSRQIAYIAMDGAYSLELVSYLSREIPKFMAHLGKNAAAVIVPCINRIEKAHWIAGAEDFSKKLEDTVRAVNA